MSKKQSIQSLSNKKTEKPTKFLSVENKGFWILIISLLVLLIIGVIIGIVMGNKVEKAQEEKAEFEKALEKDGGTKPGNDYLTFCNDDSLYAFDANFESNPATKLVIDINGNVKEITDSSVISDTWNKLKQINVGNVSEETFPINDTIKLTFTRNDGKSVEVSFVNNNMLNFNEHNFVVTSDNGFVDYVKVL